MSTNYKSIALKWWKHDNDCQWRYKKSPKGRGYDWTQTCCVVVFADKTERVIKSNVFTYSDVQDFDYTDVVAIFTRAANGGWSGHHVCWSELNQTNTHIQTMGKTRKECRDSLAKRYKEQIAKNADHKDPVKVLETRLKGHDWFYCYSDDGNVYRGGRAHKKKVLAALKDVDEAVARELWSKHAPKGFNFPTKL